jgi:hypothetical protein
MCTLPPAYSMAATSSQKKKKKKAWPLQHLTTGELGDLKAYYNSKCGILSRKAEISFFHVCLIPNVKH